MRKVLAVAAGLVLAGLGFASAQEARKLAARMAATYASEEFYFAEAAEGETTGLFKLLLPVKAGLEYLVLLASDEAACNASVRAEDDAGRLLVEDKRPGPLAGVRFSPVHDGTAAIFLSLKKSSGTVRWCAMTGRRPLPTPSPMRQEPAAAEATATPP